MTGNPLSGHTKANESSMAGTAKFTDGLTDGEHIQSPTLTNYLEGIHGNGILLEEDTAYGATNKNIPEDLKFVIRSNIGKYLRKSYEYFENPSYKPSEDVIEGAVESIAEKLASKSVQASLFDDTAFEISPIPDANYTVEVHYLNKPTSLTSGSDSGTTFLSTDYADALLYGALVEGAIFLKEPAEVVAQLEGRFKEAIARMKNTSEGRGTRDEYRYDSVRTSVT